MLSVIRSKAGGPVSEADRESTRELVPHLQTALGLQQRIAGQDARLEYASDALDYLPGCLIVTDSGGRILHMNRRAEAFLKSRNGLSFGVDGLRAGPVRQSSSHERPVQLPATAAIPAE
jgi:PAS domain-containing protein